MKNINLLKSLIVFIIVFSTVKVQAQIRAGSAFLKMLPGARLQSMAMAHTAVIDDAHAIYANPGTAGFLREWQWTASYTRWIADIYNASLIYGQTIRTPWSRYTRYAIGVLYQGMPDFDSTDMMMPVASSSDVIAGLSLGQPLTFLSKNISLGASVKYLNSKLDQYSTSGLAFDAGLAARTHRFGLGNSFLPFGIMSFGFAVTQMGPELTFNNIGTPLPLTWRAGMAFYTGSHNGMQFTLTADYQDVKDEKSAFGMGAEVSLNRLFSVNGGYSFDNDLFEKFSFGASIRLDDVTMNMSDLIPGRNNALRMDLASMNEADFFSRTYRGTASHYPIRPENFRFITTADIDTFLTSTVPVKWEISDDPDLFDSVHYTLVVDQDSIKIAGLEYLYNEDPEALLDTIDDNDFLVKQNLMETNYLVTNIIGGNYYWAVCAIDKDGHVRMAEKHNRNIAHFYVPMPDVTVDSVRFDYNPWITMDEYQGKLYIDVVNQGDRTAKKFIVTAEDSLVTLKARLDEHTPVEPYTRLVSTAVIDSLKPGQHKTLKLDWNTKWLGHHLLVVKTDFGDDLVESDESNNLHTRDIYTIPKGQISADDTTVAVINSQVVIDMPIVTEVTFDPNSSMIASDYLTVSNFDPHLSIIAERLLRYPQFRISLQGYADGNTDEPDIALADRRAKAVRDTLLVRGVRPQQIRLLPGEILPLRKAPANEEDSRWVFEERRMVKILSDSAGQDVLFYPVRHIDNETLLKQVLFKTELKYAVPSLKANTLYYGKGIRDTLSLDLTSGNSIKTELKWMPIKKEDLNWDEKSAEYHISVVDSLGRHFRTMTKDVVMHKQDFIRENRIAVPLKFAQTDPLYDFYLEKLFEQASSLFGNPSMRIAFSGHACATGTSALNERLSDRRAKSFYETFVEYMKAKHPEYYDNLVSRVDQTKGFGEYNPLQIERLTGEIILIGDNEKSTGRILNRRIEIKIYMKDSPLY